MRTSKLFKGLLVSTLLAMTAACTDYRTIPVSTVGKVVDNKGVSAETYKAGTRDIGWAGKYTKKLVLLDTSVELIPLNLKIMLSDTQEIGIQVLVKTQLDLTDKESIEGMFGLITPVDAGKNTLKIPLSLVYSKLGQDLARRTLVEVVAPHTLESFQQNRKEINDTLEKILTKRFHNTPLKLYTASINKVTYPDLYLSTASDIKTQEMSVELKAAEEVAKRAKLLEEEKTIAVDQRVRLAKAQTIKLENKKTSEGLNPMLLEYHKLELEERRLEIDLEFAKAAKVNGNSTIFYPTGQKPSYVSKLK